MYTIILAVFSIVCPEICYFVIISKLQLGLQRDVSGLEKVISYW